ncbi:MAG: 6-carboxytetrahydropterin synthase QueD [Treponema sp. CETP13]|nr:MAG: 6-carboxytetrahydropterin synthase QueD [Treponema sp. CETP13]
MFQVRVEADFAAAHFLKDYHGKCENLHGHNYKVYVHAQGENLDEGGMLLDFTQLKKALRAVCKQLDHTNLNDLAVFKDNPSAERIAMYIYEGVCKELEKTQPIRKDLIYCVDVFETETSRARYIPSK